MRDDAAPPPFDGGARAVICTTDPCATSLVTTIPLSDSDRGEGYCALLGDGTVACWGANTAGQLGRGDDAGTDDDPTPGRVVGLSDVERLDHTCALDKSGSIWCWGTGPFLRNDAGARTTERTPIKLPLPPADHVGLGAEVACASVDAGIFCWGRNLNGQLSPLAANPAWATLPPQPISIPNGAPIRDLLVGRASFILRDDGEVSSWGANPPLGRVSSLSPDPYPLPIALGGISAIDVTSGSACATTGGGGYCWGTLVGGSSPLDRALPEPVAAPQPLVQIATTTAGVTVESNTTIIRPQRWCAVGASGAVYCWGFNESGQAGDGSKANAYTAVKVQDLPTSAAQVRTMPDSTCALLTNGKVYCWGANYYGQLGNGKLRVPSVVPQEVVLP